MFFSVGLKTSEKKVSFWNHGFKIGIVSKHSDTQPYNTLP